MEWFFMKVLAMLLLAGMWLLFSLMMTVTVTYGVWLVGATYSWFAK